MNIIEAVRLASADKNIKIQRKIWVDDPKHYCVRYLTVFMDEFTSEQEHRIEPSPTDILADDWEVILIPPNERTFAEAVTAMKNGYTVQRIARPTQQYYVDDNNVFVTYRDDPNLHAALLTVDDIESTDWIVVGRKQNADSHA